MGSLDEKNIKIIIIVVIVLILILCLLFILKERMTQKKILDSKLKEAEQKLVLAIDKINNEIKMKLYERRTILNKVKHWQHKVDHHKEEL